MRGVTALKEMEQFESKMVEYGAANEKPAHAVTLTQPFYMGKYTVTQEQYEAVVGRNPSHFKGAQLPVEMVSWGEAMAF